MSAQISSTSVNLEPGSNVRVNQAVQLRGQFVATIFNDSPTEVDIQLDGQLDSGAGYTKSDSAHKKIAPNETATLYLPLWLTAYYSQPGRVRLSGNLQIYDRNNWQTIGYDSRYLVFEIEAAEA